MDNHLVFMDITTPNLNWTGCSHLSEYGLGWRHLQWNGYNLSVFKNIAILIRFWQDDTNYNQLGRINDIWGIYSIRLASGHVYVTFFIIANWFRRAQLTVDCVISRQVSLRWLRKVGMWPRGITPVINFPRRYFLQVLPLAFCLRFLHWYSSVMRKIHGNIKQNEYFWACFFIAGTENKTGHKLLPCHNFSFVIIVMVLETFGWKSHWFQSEAWAKKSIIKK